MIMLRFSAAWQSAAACSALSWSLLKILHCNVGPSYMAAFFYLS
jgi:hypothetical protein